MKSAGEVQAIGRNFEEAFQKALRMLDQGYKGFEPGLQPANDFDLKHPPICAPLCLPQLSRMATPLIVSLKWQRLIVGSCTSVVESSKRYVLSSFCLMHLFKYLLFFFRIRHGKGPQLRHRHVNFSFTPRRFVRLMLRFVLMVLALLNISHYYLNQSLTVCFVDYQGHYTQRTWSALSSQVFRSAAICEADWHR